MLVGYLSQDLASLNLRHNICNECLSDLVVNERVTLRNVVTIRTTLGERRGREHATNGHLNNALFSANVSILGPDTKLGFSGDKDLNATHNVIWFATHCRTIVANDSALHCVA